MSEKQSNKQSFSSNNSLLAGIIIGAALMYLFGTKNGQITRDQIIKEGKKLLEKLGDELEETTEEIKSHAEDIKEDVTKSVENVKVAVAESIENVSELRAVPTQKKFRRLFFRRGDNES